MFKKLTMALAMAIGAMAAGTTHSLEPYITLKAANQDFEFDNQTGSDTGFVIGGGLTLNPTIDIEASYVDYDGEADDVNAFLEGNSLEFAGIFKYPMNDSFTLFGKAGLEMWEADIYGPVCGGNCVSDDGFDPFFGFGVLFSVSPKFDLTVDYSMHDFDDAESDNFTLGVRYKFEPMN